MAFRFRRTMTIAPGVRVNLGKRGPSLTVGGKFGRVTAGPSGAHLGASIPGTGIYMTEKLGASSNHTAASPQRVTARRPAPSTATEQHGSGTLMSIVRGLPPVEPGTAGFIAALTNSPKRQALQAIARAAATPSPEGDAAVAAAVALAPESWTVRREAGLYYMQRGDSAAAVSHLAEAANRFPGQRVVYYLLAADAGIDADNFAYAISALEPYVGDCDPDSDLGGLIITTLANACLRSGDPDRSLELIARLPLRKRILNDTLLYALCVRACANGATGKKAQAKKDIDRVYANRPDFPLLAEASRQALSEAASC